MSIDVLQQYFGRFAIDANSKDLIVGVTATELTTGNYYVQGYTGESTNQLCEHLQSIIRNVSGYDNTQVSYSYTTGKITIAFYDAAVSPFNGIIEFTDTNLRDILGFTGNLSGATTQTAANQPRGVWRPTLGWAEYPLQAANFWAPQSTSYMGMSKDGTSYSTVGTLVNVAPSVRYENLPEEDVITPGTGTVQRDFQEFWRQIAHNGQPIRIYPDRSLNASTSYVTALLVPFDDDEQLGALTDYVSRRISTYNGLWNVQLRFFEFST